MRLRHGGGLWVRTGGHAYRRCCGDWSGCDTCPKITQVSNNYARVLTPASSVLFVQIQAMFYMTYCPQLKLQYMLYVHVNMTEFYLLQTVWHAKLLLLG